MAAAESPPTESSDFFERMANFQRSLKNLQVRKQSQANIDQASAEKARPMSAVPLSLTPSTIAAPAVSPEFARTVVEPTSPAAWAKASNIGAGGAAISPASIGAVGSPSALGVLGPTGDSDGAVVATPTGSGGGHSGVGSGGGGGYSGVGSGVAGSDIRLQFQTSKTEAAFGSSSSVDGRRLEDSSLRADRPQPLWKDQQAPLQSTAPPSARSQSSQLTAGTSSAVGARLHRGRASTHTALPTPTAAYIPVVQEDAAAETLIQVSQRVNELERQLARKQRDAERLAESNARLRLESSALRGGGPVPRFDGFSDDDGAASEACTADDRNSQHERAEAVRDMVKARSALAKGWVPLCAPLGDEGGSTERSGDISNASGVDSTCFKARFKTPAPYEPWNAFKKIDDEVPEAGENIFRRGSLWLWSRQLANLDSDIAELLGESPENPKSPLRPLWGL
eukprot:TRINITY_DN43117_c0_g1_i1.p1 TRINITY_DN43117_c0_g1~~TRINITY_DN43117_c0_g1_i1.p1  ORF type:complete len:453 (-),score=90.30 TRINITY_DN43117_c0_g1_i1:124-1482(-)